MVPVWRGETDATAATGLDVFDKTLQTTNIWLDEIAAEIGPDRQVAWHALGAVLRALRDRIPLDLAAHLGAQLPLLARGLYYDQWHPAAGGLESRPGPERAQPRRVPGACRRGPRQHPPRQRPRRHARGQGAWPGETAA
jgi:Uncharacterized conserved protein (DUF2267)